MQHRLRLRMAADFALGGHALTGKEQHVCRDAAHERLGRLADEGVVFPAEAPSGAADRRVARAQLVNAR